MRVLVVTLPALGHFFPLVPLARALVERGHGVRVATAVEIHREVKNAGLIPVPAGLSLDRMRAELRRCIGENRYTELMPGTIGARMFAHVAPRQMLTDLQEYSSRWRPDVIVHEEGEYAAPLLAAILRVPNVCVSWAAPRRSEVELDRIERALRPLWASKRLAIPRHAGMFRNLFLDGCPRSLKGDSRSDDATQSMRPELYDGGDPLIDRHESPLAADRDTVYVTMGTVEHFGVPPGDFRMIVRAIRKVGLRAVVTCSNLLDDEVSSLVGEGAIVHNYVPQSVILPKCMAVVCHGGAGTTLGALAHGLPVLILPRGAASQRRMADACSRIGVGRVIEASDLSSELLYEELMKLLTRSRYGSAAESLSREIRAMPSSGAAALEIEAMV